MSDILKLKRSQFTPSGLGVLNGQTSVLGLEREDGWSERFEMDGQTFVFIDKRFERGSGRVLYASYTPLRTLVRIYNDSGV